jgi:hypothetical protein
MYFKSKGAGVRGRGEGGKEVRRRRERISAFAVLSGLFKFSARSSQNEFFLHLFLYFSFQSICKKLARRKGKDKKINDKEKKKKNK